MAKKRVFHSFIELLDRLEYTEGDNVFVVDTSFLTTLSNSHVWALNALGYANFISQTRHGVIIVPTRVEDQHNRFFTDGVTDEFGIPLAYQPSQSLIPDYRLGAMYLPSPVSDFSKHIWEQSLEGRKRFEQRRSNPEGVSPGPGQADIDVISYALNISRQGADVYVISSDFKDVITPIRAQHDVLKELGLRVTAVPPSPLNSQYSMDKKPKIEATVTGEVIKQLQDVKSTGSYYTLVIFERGVTSGDVTFDVGVGVVIKEYFREIVLPEQFNCIRDRIDMVPVVRVGSGHEKDLKSLTQATRQFKSSTRFVAINQEFPYFPRLFDAGLLYIGKWKDERLWRSDLNYLFYNSNSVFAKENYK